MSFSIIKNPAFFITAITAVLLALVFLFNPALAFLVLVIFYLSYFAMVHTELLMWISLGSGVFANVLIIETGYADIRFIQFFWLVTITIALLKTLASRKSLKFKLTPTRNALIIFLIFYLLSTFTAVNIERAVVDFFQIFGLVLIFFYIEIAINTPEKVKKAVTIIIYAGIFFLLCGVFQKLFNSSPIPQIIISTSKGIIFSFEEIRHEFVAQNILVKRNGALFFHFVATGCITTQLLIISIAGLTSKGEPSIFRISCKVVIILGSALLLFTYARSAILAFGAGLLMIIFFQHEKRGLYLFCLVCAVLLFINSPMSSRLHETAEFGIKSSTTEQHLVLWLIAIKMITEQPFLGFGAGAFESYVAKLGPIVKIEGFTAWVGGGMACHNILLQLAAENGVIAALALSFFILLLLKKLLKAYKNCEVVYRWQLLALMTSVFVGFVINLISNFFIREAFWILLGIASAASEVYLRYPTKLVPVRKEGKHLN